MLQEHGDSLFEPVVPARDRPYMGHTKSRIILRQERTQPHDRIHQIHKSNLPGIYDKVDQPIS